MARLPEPGGDSGQWGDLLNDYLSIAHNSDGTIKNGAISNASIQNNAITVAKIATTGTPTSGQTLTYDGTDLSWTTVSGSGSVPDANASTKGLVQLTGDFGGTAASPTVPGLAGKEATVNPGTTAQYYRGDKSWQTLDKTAVDLANVDNTSDSSKPISTATQTALDGKQASITPGTTTDYYRGDKTWQSLNKYAVNLGNVDDTSDLDKPISTAVQAALNNKASGSHTHAASAITTGTLDAGRLPAASDTEVGAVELATDAEAIAGTDTTRAVTPAGVKVAVEAAVEAIPQPEVVFVDTLGDLAPGTPVDTLVVVRAA